MPLVEDRTAETASRRRRLPLVMLELVGALAAHAVEVILSAGMLRPRMTTLGTFAQPPELAGCLPPLPSPFQKATHEFEDASFRIRTCRDSLVHVSGGSSTTVGEPAGRHAGQAIVLQDERMVKASDVIPLACEHAVVIARSAQNSEESPRGSVFHSSRGCSAQHHLSCHSLLSDLS